MAALPHAFPNEHLNGRSNNGRSNNDWSNNDWPNNDRSNIDRSNPEGADDEPSSRRTVLLVEDEPFVRDAAYGVLQSSGFAVFPAENARAALLIHATCGREIDLVITDMVMPGLSGEQLGQALRERSPQLVVLITSGYPNPEYENEAPETKTYFLPKPYSRKTLIAKIDEILGPLARVGDAQAG